MSKLKQKIDYQLDLTPFISLLSVCICFLLLTVAWFQIGSLTMKQVLGGDTSEGSAEKKPSIWISLKNSNHIQIQLKEIPSSYKISSKKKIIAPTAIQKALNYEPLYKYVKTIKQKIPQIDQAFILPQKANSYEDIIRIMDQLRKAGVFNLGIAPL